MTKFIDLQRRFSKLQETELEASEHLAYLGESEFYQTLGWPELLAHARVIVLAEAGTGKTREMDQQAKRLASEGKFAFFVALESLSRDRLDDLLSPSEEIMFKAWKADGQDPAWFFLDAVDELKLTGGKFDKALLRLSKDIDGHLDRARLIISSRPTDWRPNIDLTTVHMRLPLLQKKENTILLPSDELFIETIRHQNSRPAPPKKVEKIEAADGTIATVVLLPMSERQIALFAEQSGVQDPTAFLSEIAKRDAWTFARRPLDLAELITAWTNYGTLGTRAQQHEANVVTKLQDDPERPDQGVLPDTKARLGAERLALALALTRTRTIRSPEQSLDVRRVEGVLDLATILRDWSEQERRTLLRRAMFDPATYGRVRFHHRSVQEYLAARRLLGLREKGMATNALFRLLFSTRYGIDVVFPSMKPIASWLALWDEDVRRELTLREPEALLSLGDPESLPLTARAELVRAFAAAYGHGGWIGLNIPIDEVRRLAHPDLAPVIRELWDNNPTNDDVSELLVEIIWKGQIDSCSDLAHAAALNVNWSYYHRVVAIKALLACGRDDTVRELADSILGQPESWPDKAVIGLAADLFPRIITVDELVALIERTRKTEHAVDSFDWELRQIIKALKPQSELAVALRDKIAELIWQGRHPEQEYHHIRSRYDHLTPALSLLCTQQLSTIASRTDANLIHACVIASRFGKDRSDVYESDKNLESMFKENAALRSVAFWADLKLMDEFNPAKDDWHRFYQSGYHSLLGHLAEIDRPWLKEALADDSHPERRAVALHALLNDWYQRRSDTSDLASLYADVEDDANLKAVLSERTAPPERNAELERMERARRRRERAHAAKEKQRLLDWEKWRGELIADPDAAFSVEKQGETVANLHSWLRAWNKERGRYNVWNKDALIRAFDLGIANRAEKAFRELWRATHPLLWSERPADERNTTSYNWLYGLCGVSAESSTTGWSASLSPDEARIATAYSTVELNGFAPFITDLVQAHPADVTAVLGSELIAELAVGAEQHHLPTLQDLTYADITLKRLLSPRLLEALLEWPRVFTAESGQFLAHHLDQTLRILEETITSVDRQIIDQECAQRYEADPFGPLALVWLRGLFRLDAERATSVMIKNLSTSECAQGCTRAVEMFTRLFGDRDIGLSQIADLDKRAQALGRLVRSAYAFIRHEDDISHEGVYRPGPRDKAQTARNFLLSALLNTPGAEAQRVIHELASEPDFAHFPDHLRLLARQKTATDAEFAPYDPNDLATLESRYEAPPHDQDGLFTVMMDRLNDLAHDLSHDDFTDRVTLRNVMDEVEMQRTLAWRIKGKSNGAYIISREEEVADRKRTDFRLSAVNGDQKCVIELKIADSRWSLSQLERALRSQLVGQYLRHSTCKSGCLLLTYNGTKVNWQNPLTKKRLNFHAVIDYLNDKARTLEIESSYSIRLSVFGLDLTDPPLATGQNMGSKANLCVRAGQSSK